MSERFSEIIESADEFQRLKNEVQRGEVSKTILLLSKDEEYSFAFARHLAQLIFDGKIDKTSDNYLKVESFSHPDLKIYPSRDKLFVGDSEEIVYESSVKPIFADKKIFIIKNIESSMESAQNKLLKTLEEPQENVYFILTCSNIDALLPTVRSRCDKRVLNKVSDSIIKQYYAKSDLLIELCEGNIGRAEKLSQMQNLDEIFQNTLNVIVKLKSSKDVLYYAKPLTEEYGNVDLIISILSMLIEDLLFIKIEGKCKHFKGAESQLQAVSGEYSIKALIEITKKIGQALKELSYNCNNVVVIENLLLNLLEEKYLCK